MDYLREVDAAQFGGEEAAPAEEPEPVAA